jgi:peptidoglycan/LPS O-acetylase OafA/YrhL
MKKIDNLTGVRAFAALWVVIFHFQSSDGISGLNLGSLIQHGYLGVDIFFVLSGLILSLLYCEQLPGTFSFSWLREFIIKRIAKLYPLHLVTFLVMVLVVLGARYAGSAYRHEGDNTAWSAIANLFLIHAWGVTSSLSWNAPSWSISAEWFAYCLVFPIMVYGLRQKRLFVVIGLCAVLWGAYVFGALHWSSRGLSVTTAGVTRIVPEFLIGYAVYRSLGKTKDASGDLLSLIGIALLVSACLIDGGYLVLAAPAIAITLVGLYVGGPISDVIFGNRLAIFVGKISYSIYMLQLFVQMAANQMVRHLHIQYTPRNALMLLFGELGVAILAGCAAYYLLEEPLRLRLLDLVKRGDRARADIGLKTSNRPQEISTL